MRSMPSMMPMPSCVRGASFSKSSFHSPNSALTSAHTLATPAADPLPSFFEMRSAQAMTVAVQQSTYLSSERERRKWG
jgi:hypothetical protein